MARHTLLATIVADSIDAFPSLLAKLQSEIIDEFHSGKIVADDDDSIEWRIESERKEP